MNYRNIGNSGLVVSEVGIGCNNFGARIGKDDSRAVIGKALDLGVTLFDTADLYGNRGGSEEILGEVLAPHRDEVVLASKFGWQMDDAGLRKGASRRYIVQAVEASLRRLRTDRIDLYQLHRPDPLTPLEETVRALDDLVRAGKVLYVGCSNLPPWQVVEALWAASDLKAARFISCQDELSLLVRKSEAGIPMLERFGLGLLPFYPLAAGMLTGKYRRGEQPAEGTRLRDFRAAVHDRHTDERNWEIIERLAAFCERRGRSMVELAFGWLLAKPVVASVIAGATTPAQVAANVEAAGAGLTAEELSEIQSLIDG